MPTYIQTKEHTHHTHAHRYTHACTHLLKKREKSTTASTKVTVTTPGTETDGWKGVFPQRGQAEKEKGGLGPFVFCSINFDHSKQANQDLEYSHPPPPGSFHTLLSSCYPHRLTHSLGLLSIAVMKHHDWKQLGREKVYSTSQFRIHDEGVSAQELKAGTEAEAMGPVKLKLSTLCLCLQVCAATSIHAINIFKAIINLVIHTSRDRWTKETKETFVKGGEKKQTNAIERQKEERVYSFMLQNPFLLVQSSSWF